MSNISFKANFLKTIYIPQKKSENQYESSEVSIVELDIKDKNDVNALAKTACDWENIASGFAYNIYNEALKFKTYPDVINEKYLAITKQNQDYKKLNPDKILGLAMLSEKDAPKNELDWLQVKPSTNFRNSQDRKYTGIGSALVNYIKEISDKPIYVQSADDAIGFYRKQGFKSQEAQIPSKMIWEV